MPFLLPVISFLKPRALCIKTDILSTLAYFDLFNYPITQTEIALFSRHTHHKRLYTDALQALVREKRVFQFEEFFTLHDERCIVTRRRKGNGKAKQLLVTAEKVASVLACFPFVRGVAVSGSLSKNFADEESDIDLFIITAPNRLWLARTLLHCLKKVSYLLNKQHLLCMNYFVDEAALEIREKNIYTATEVVTLLPLRGIAAFDAFYAHNGWTRTFLPNHSMRISHIKDNGIRPLGRLVELCLDHGLGNLLDTMLMKLTAFRWHKKTERGRRNLRGVVMSMRATKHVAKPDPVTYQDRLVQLYEKKVSHLASHSPVNVQSAY
jgi:predicted nucleotidyltransferase